jgi:serine phosphatase RsbU (regulator of sigma subunit)
MAVGSILVLSERSQAIDQLRELLDASGIATRVADPRRIDPGADAPDLVLACTDADLELVRETVREIALRTNRSTTVVMFTDDDISGRAPVVLSALDFLVPRPRPRPDAGATVLKYQRAMVAGREIQAGFLPETLPRMPGWQFAARYQPAAGVSGDFYDVFVFDGGDRIGLVVADVCDKGIGAALYMALIRGLLRYTAVTFDSQRQEPASDVSWLLRAITATNDYLTANHLRHGYFATMFFAVLDPRTGALAFSNCGHNPPIIRKEEGALHLLEPTGPALGLLSNSTFGLASTRLEHGDLLFVYTDGVTDARDKAGRFFTKERMLALIGAHTTAIEDLLDRIEREISGHVSVAERFDDITMVALQRQHARPVDEPGSRPA